MRKLKDIRLTVIRDTKILRKSRQRKTALHRSKKETVVKRSDKRQSAPNSWLSNSSRKTMKEN